MSWATLTSNESQNKHNYYKSSDERRFPLNKAYQYSQQRAIFGIYVPTILAAMIMLIMIYELIFGNPTLTTLPLAILAAIIFLDHYLALSHPNRVVIDTNSIEFSCFGRKHTYDFTQIQRINIRKTAFSKSIYVRINSASLLKGRYWLQIEQFNEGQDLQILLEKLVELKHPMMKNFDHRSFVKTKKNKAV